ncbi:MAG TPA: PSD1 and planctomycete cytochrome C domain-containing protein [Pirellulales bacterium]
MRAGAGALPELLAAAALVWATVCLSIATVADDSSKLGTDGPPLPSPPPQRNTSSAENPIRTASKSSDTVRPPAPAGSATPAGSDKTADAKNKPTSVDFYHDIKPIFVKHCFVCHGPAKAESGLRLDQRAAAFKGGDSGAVITKGNSAASLLFQYVSGKNDSGIVMPPKGKAAALAPQQVELLRLWIDQGADWPDSRAGNRTGSATDGKSSNSPSDGNSLSDHWAFQPVHPAKPPALGDAWIDTPIDAFIFAKLSEHQLAPNPRASRIDLIRRVTFDLTGLPPTPVEVQHFLDDLSEDAYERLVDRLLASPRYGEHWGRHWLDLARYADSDGFENDTDRVNAYKYRDYVIRSFNDDKPYNRFIVEQLAGDELGDANPEHLVALGFCRSGPTIGNQLNEKNRVDEVDDIVSTTSSVFLGLTVGCARCHDHKYEPISQRDYYRMFAIFNNADKVNDGEMMQLRDRTANLRKTYVMLGGEYQHHGDEVQPGIPAVLEDGRAHYPLIASTVDIQLGTARSVTSESQGDVGTAPTTDLEAVARANSQTSVGRRLALAQWIADPENPLTARVMVNRLWTYHFGRGLVNTPSNLGQSGDDPTHLELLDYLATALVHGGWKLKPLQKMIVMSAAYRQSSAYDPEKSSADPDDQWYWRFPVRRIDAESIRDSILAAAGKLNLQMYGPGVKPRIPATVLSTTSKEMWPKVQQEGPTEWRRSVYVFVKRSVLLPMLEGFDAPTATQTCERRMTTTVATQALQLLNDAFSNEQAGYTAARIAKEVGGDLERQVDRAYWLTLCRPPTDVQRRQGVDFLVNRMEAQRQAAGDAAKGSTATTAARAANPATRADLEAKANLRALADLCHVLFNSNEFVYLN